MAAGRHFTVLGGHGFVGRAVVGRLRGQGAEVVVPDRDWVPAGGRESLGHLIYCAGLTSDFRQRPWDTIEAHVCGLNRIVAAGGFISLLYLSSTRVYAKAKETAEDTPLVVSPQDPSDLYNLSKLTGEAICLRHPSPTVRVARLSNVIGPDGASGNFVNALIRAAITDGEFVLETAGSSEKDYIWVEDVADLLIRIATTGRQRLYNLGSGENVTNAAIAEAVAKATGAGWSESTNAPSWSFPPLDVRRLKDEFNVRHRPILSTIPDIVAALRLSDTGQQRS